MMKMICRKIFKLSFKGSAKHRLLINLDDIRSLRLSMSPLFNSHDSSNLRFFISLARHFLFFGFGNMNEDNHGYKSHDKRIPGTSRKRRHNSDEWKQSLGATVDKELMLQLLDGPTVMINDCGLRVKMICPSNAVIQKCSPYLSSILSSELVNCN